MSNIPKEEFKIPVCIADLPAAKFQVPPETLTETVVAELENSPQLPGVLIVEKNQFVGMITRLKLFERLGHRYGVELFLRKPIIHLKEFMRVQTRALPGHIKVDEAVQQALTRDLADIYDPVVVDLGNKMYRILDMNVLLLAQSHTVSNLSNIVGKLQQLDNLIYLDREREEIFRRMLNLMGQVVPYHQAAIVVQQDRHMHFAASSGFGNVNQSEVDHICKNSIYKMLLRHRQPIFLPDAAHVHAWSGMKALGMPCAWLGIPLLDGERPLGLLSIGRNINSPFTADEKETATAFAQRMVTVLLRREKKSSAGLDTQLHSLIDIGRESGLNSQNYFKSFAGVTSGESVF